jgi:hypothetical protein
VTPCAIYTVHVEMRCTGFLVEPQNQWRVLWLSIKTKVRFLASSSKPRSTVSQFGPQNRQLWFGDLGLKITASVSWVGPQNRQLRFGDLQGQQIFPLMLSNTAFFMKSINASTLLIYSLQRHGPYIQLRSDDIYVDIKKEIMCWMRYI